MQVEAWVVAFGFIVAVVGCAAFFIGALVAWMEERDADAWVCALTAVIAAAVAVFTVVFVYNVYAP